MKSSTTSRAIIIAVGVAVGGCGTEVIYLDGAGANNSGGANSGGANSGGANSGGNNTGASNVGGSNVGGSNVGGGSGVDCLSAENFDPCSSPGSYCSYYDAGTNEYCDAYCGDDHRWQKSCYEQPTYCYEPPLCPAAMPANGSQCVVTEECEYYDCEYAGVCGGTGYGSASCQDGYFYTYADCYCYQPPTLCPSSPPQNGSACTTTAQCQTYDCEWNNACGAGTYQYAYCDGGFWYSDGDCD